MKSFSTSSIGRILKWLLIFIFVFGVIFTPFCHWFIYKFGNELLGLPSISSDPVLSAVTGDLPTDIEYKFIIMEVYTLGVIMLGIVTQLIRICVAIEKNNPFSNSTVASLNNMSILSLILVIIYIIKIAVYPSIPSVVVIIAFIIVGLISYVFSKLFKKASEYKAENDLTI